MKEPKIVQIISITKPVWAVYKATGDGDEPSANPILVGALYSDGSFGLLDGCSIGLFECPSLTSNFVGFIYGELPLDWKETLNSSF